MPMLSDKIEIEHPDAAIIYNALEGNIDTTERASAEMTLQENKIIFELKATDATALKAIRSTITRLTSVAMKALE